MEWKPYTPQTRRELLDVHAAFFLQSPDGYLELPGVAPERQRTLESTVADMHRGVDHIFRWPWHGGLRRRLHDVIEIAFAHFREGRVHEGRMTCHELEDLISGAWF